MVRRGRPDNGCEHLPALMAMPGHPDFVAVECLKCHMTTGYGTDAYEAWEAWMAGNVVVPYDMFEGEG